MMKKDKSPASKTKSCESPEELRRGFLKKFGKYAVTTPLVTFTLMSAFTSKAIASDDEGPGD